MKVTLIPIVIDTLGTIPEGFIYVLEGLEIRRQVETIHTTALLRSVRIIKRVRETWGLDVTQTPVSKTLQELQQQQQ